MDILRDKIGYLIMLTNIKGYHKLQSHNILVRYYNLEKLIAEKKLHF